ncbi:MAG: response regulator [Paenibacillaceae bacterium]|nr:response regulator [Paenibacillaceae bacterium]
MAQVLIIDDIPFMKHKLRRLAEECGCEIAGEADNGRNALRLAAEKKPELVIMEIMMPDMDGIEIIRSLKELRQDIMVIVCSAVSHQHVIVSAVKAGAQDYIVKPFFDSRVLSSIQGLLENSSGYKNRI